MTRETETILSHISDLSKLVIDILKHLTTLSTAAIVFMATFLEKLPTHYFRACVTAAVIFLLVSIVTSANACFSLSTSGLLSLEITNAIILSEESDTLRSEIGKSFDAFKAKQKRGYRDVKVASISFVLGIVSIGVYIVANSR